MKSLTGVVTVRGVGLFLLGLELKCSPLKVGLLKRLQYIKTAPPLGWNEVHSFMICLTTTSTISLFTWIWLWSFVSCLPFLNDSLQFLYCYATWNHDDSCWVNHPFALIPCSQLMFKMLKFNTRVCLHVLFLHLALPSLSNVMCVVLATVCTEYYPPWPDSLHRLVLIWFS